MAIRRTATNGQVARALKVSARTVTKWAKEGCPHARASRSRRAPLRYNIAEVRAWMKAHGRSGRPGRPPVASDANADIREGTSLLLEERIISARLENERKANKLHDVDACEARQLAKIRVLKAALLNLGHSVALACEGRPAAEIESALNARVRILLEEFSSGEDA